MRQVLKNAQAPMLAFGSESWRFAPVPERLGQNRRNTVNAKPIGASQQRMRASKWKSLYQPFKRATRMTTIKDWLTATGRDLDQHFTTARDKLSHAPRVASEKVTPVAHRFAENVGSAYQAAKPRVEAAVVYAAPRVKHGVKYAVIHVLRFVINAERKFLNYVEAHLPKEDETGPPLAEPSPVEPVAPPKARISVAGGKNEDDGGNASTPHLQT
jgi:hypothetical protein